MEECPISYTYMDRESMIKIGNYFFNPEVFKKYIISLNLGIHIDIATDEEWVLTAKTDTWDNTNNLRLKNPMTNLPLSTTELIYLYNNLSNFIHEL